MMEFHIARKARERYQFVESLFSYAGNVVFANVTACREFAYRINKVRDVEKHPEQAVHAGQLYAMGLIDEASHVLMARYRERFDPAVMSQALEWFSGIVGAEPLGRMLLTFVEEFPGASVICGQMTPRQWLSGETDGASHWAVALEELLLLWTANRNEAFQPFEELFQEKSLAEKTVYRQVTRHFPDYFATRPLIPLPGAKPMSLLELLRAPAVGAPRSLSEQLALIRKLWKPMLGDSLDHFLLIAGEILHEEELAIWMQFNPPAVQAREAARRHRESGQKQWPDVVSTAEVPVFGDPAHEYEKFSADTAWMPTVVLIAKSTYVWLAQMSRQYGRAINRLDEIPDEELVTLARRGLNSLWLIGVWERSRASKTIKLLCGNADAVASAYSLFDYAIAEDLGGEAAYTNLRDRAYRHGIRLASDMVPNHMGIDSPWVIEHPEWFISRPEPPYPAYSYNGPDLSRDARVEIKIEDHYYDESDAAVVFRRRDLQSGETRYIYHGNDGTSFPWNDTAQLDYLNPAVREQVIQTILHVARLFPVIRFDAAMTLAKRHFHRLWFPGPGTSGAIPSRAEYGMSQSEFNRAMPHEFWREVVDRVAAEVPGTLLLAEAFWLMEGYFVRTLGMHRVYNSAFMVMLRDEDNAKYRSVIKNTLEFDPDIMKRYVNFMSNPDERTAIDQFGKGDKCFGVATMMATLPGLPMFGHGQIEGFTEKYGMEYQRPRYDENADPWMIERHEREIAPLLKRRRLFAESSNFLLYDFFTDSGKVDENVFAYSNRRGDERALVVYNNHYGHTHGTIDYSVAYADKGANQLRQQRIREGLGLNDNSGAVFAWRDSLTGLEYLRRANDLSDRGFTLDLGAFQCHVFLDWRELYSTAEQPWDRLSDQLNGRGVASLDDALVKLELEPAHDALRQLLEPAMVRLFADLAEHPRTLAGGIKPGLEAERTEFFETAWARCENFLRQAQKSYLALAGSGAAAPANPGLLRAAFRERLRSAMRIPALEALFPAPWTVAARRMLPSPSPQLTATAMWGPVLAWCVLELLAESIDAENPERMALELFDRLRLREPFAQLFAALGFEGEEAWRVAARVKVGLLTGAGVGKAEKSAPEKDTDDTNRAETLAGQAEASGHDLSRAISPKEKDTGDTNHAETLAGQQEVSGHDFSRAVRASSSTRALAPEGEAVPSPVLGPALWQDPDVRWLCGVHPAEGHDYLVRERYEELLWWLLMPSLLRLAGESAPGRVASNRAAVRAMSKSLSEALAAAEAAGYRVDLLQTPAAVEVAAEEPAAEAEIATEAAVEPAAESEAASIPEPEPIAEATPVPTEESEPAGPEIAVAVEPAVELVPETEAASISEPEPIAEATPVPAEQLDSTGEPEPAEPEIEAAVESVVEPEVAAEPLPLPSEEPEPIEPEIEAAIEPAAETEAASIPEPEPIAEATPMPAEQIDSTEAPEIEPAAVESPAETETTSISEPEPIAEATPVPEEQLDSTEEPEPAEPEVEAALEPIVETEAATEPQPLPSEEPEPIEPEIEAAAVEPVNEPEPIAEATPVPEEQLESIEEPEPDEPEIEAAAVESAAELVPESEDEPISAPEPIAEATPLPEEQLDSTEEPEPPEPEIEVALEPTIETEVATEPQPLTHEEPEPAEPEIEATLEPAVELVPESESEAASIPETEPIAEATPVPDEQLESIEEPESDEPEIEAAVEPAVELEVVAEPLPLPTEEPEPAEPEIEAAVEPAAAEPIPETEDEPELAADEPESAVESGKDQTEQAEAESEPPENLPSGAKGLVDSIASIFARKPAHFAKTSILGLSDTQPSSDEPWEPATAEAGFAANSAAEAEPESVQSVVPQSAFTVPWEPPPLKIEFTAKTATEFEAVPETEAAEQPLPNAHPEPAEPEPDEPENEPPPELEADPDDPLWPPRA
jgi:glycosidase